MYKKRRSKLSRDNDNNTNTMLTTIATHWVWKKHKTKIVLCILVILIGTGVGVWLSLDNGSSTGASSGASIESTSTGATGGNGEIAGASSGASIESTSTGAKTGGNGETAGASSGASIAARTSGAKTSGGEIAGASTGTTRRGAARTVGARSSNVPLPALIAIGICAAGAFVAILFKLATRRGKKQKKGSMTMEQWRQTQKRKRANGEYLDCIYSFYLDQFPEEFGETRTNDNTVKIQAINKNGKPIEKYITSVFKERVEKTSSQWSTMVQEDEQRRRKHDKKPTIHHAARVYGLNIVEAGGGGDCQFKSIAKALDMVKSPAGDHIDVRAAIVQEMRTKKSMIPLPTSAMEHMTITSTRWQNIKQMDNLARMVIMSR